MTSVPADRTETAPKAPPDRVAFDSELSGKSLDMKLLIRLLRWVGPHKRYAVWSIIFVLVASGLAVLGPVVITRVVIDGILRPASGIAAPTFGMDALTDTIAALTGLGPLGAACLLYGALIGSWAMLSHFHRILLARAVLGALRDLRHDLFAHLERLPSAFYDRVAVGRVMTRVTNDIEQLFNLLSGFGVLIGEFVPFFVALGLMLAIDPELTGILLLVAPILGTATYFFRRATRRVYRDIRQSVSMLNQNLQENLSGLQVVQLHRREDRNLRRYTDINTENLSHERNAVTLESLYGPFVESLASAAVGVILWFGGRNVLEGAITLGSLVLFSQYIDMLFQPIVRIGEQYNVLFRAMASGERIFQALDWHERLTEPEQPTRLDDRLAGAIEFRNLTFAYETGEAVLRNVSFEIRPGEKIAIVGPTGSGKTTLIRLLGRFYDFDRGQIFLDGTDLADIALRDLRKRIGIVLQDFHVFSGTVAENIALGNPNIGRERVIEAARLVHAEGFIRALPQGFDTPLVERGQNLSHGQRQLLSFARVLAADPEILILDEATASIDTETELVIQDALRRLTKGRTSIIIAHRLQTIREADRIVVMEYGHVREIGTHDELIARGGLYRTLYELQFQESAA